MRYIQLYRQPRRSFTHDIDRFFSGFDRLFEDFPPSRNVSNYSNVQFQEQDDHYLIHVDLPGVPKEDIQIETKDGQLWISVDSEASESSGDKNLWTTKRHRGFKRGFQLPREAANEAIEAHYENGVLQVAIPKEETAKPRKVEVQSSKSGFFNKLLGKDTSKDTNDVK